jgi:lysophospholipid acyltransferase (LPLAT)-like uncharacterized protein
MKLLKKLLFNNFVIRWILSFILMLYLRFVYMTTHWKFISTEGQKIEFPSFKQVIIVAWHNRLTLMPYFLRKVNNLYSLASPHADGMIIAWILRFLSLKVIQGSTNRDAFIALKHIIKLLKDGANIGITPDGPRGPRYKINSNLVSAARIADASIIVTGCYISKFIELKTWDKLIFPLPFATGTFVIDEALKVTKDINSAELNNQLEERMNFLNEIAKKYNDQT